MSSVDSPTGPTQRIEIETEQENYTHTDEDGVGMRSDELINMHKRVDQAHHKSEQLWRRDE